MVRDLPVVSLALVAPLVVALCAGCSEPSSEGSTASSGSGGSGGAATSTSSSVDTSSSSTAAAGGGSVTSTGSGGSGTGGSAEGPGDDGWPVQVFAPFVDATAYPTPKLGEIAQNAGVLHYALGFLVAQDASSCQASWGTYYDLDTGPSAWDGGAEYFLYDHIAQLRALGGDVLVSFGGAAGTELAGACADVDTLAAEYEKVIDKLALTRVDFDIEGFWVADTTSIQRRSAAMEKVQAHYTALGKPLTIWLTLPVLPTGLTSEGVAVVNAALDAGVNLGGVNIMTMDYGDSAAPNPDGQMGSYGTGAATALQGQLAIAYQRRFQDRRRALVARGDHPDDWHERREQRGVPPDRRVRDRGLCQAKRSVLAWHVVDQPRPRLPRHQLRGGRLLVHRRPKPGLRVLPRQANLWACSGSGRWPSV